MLRDQDASSSGDEDARLLADLRRRLAAAGDDISSGLLGALEAELARQAAELKASAAALMRYRKMYERASSRARIGVWECDLATEELNWTDGVYDLFGLRHGSAVNRETILSLYDEVSRREMEALRGKAIREGGGFTLDIRIRTVDGQPRWVRLSADVEMEDGRPVRIFGTKQDITLEKELWNRMRLLAETDPLTGVANRAVFEMRLAEALALSGGEGLGALVLIDGDGFKQINDTFGHAAGDECLRHLARRLSAVFHKESLVARIGGDEFAVLLFGTRQPAEVDTLAQAAIDAICEPVDWQAQPISISASIGIAMAGVAGGLRGPASDDLSSRADRALYAAKAAGRNRHARFELLSEADEARNSARRPLRPASVPTDAEVEETSGQP